MTDSDGCCRCCCSFIFTLGLTALFMWLSLRTDKPTCSIQHFYLPALNKTLNTTKNATIYLDLKLDNGNNDKGIHYDALNVTFFYVPNISRPIGSLTIPGFYQGHKKKARRKQLVNTTGVDWQAVSRVVSANGSAVFRVDLATAVRFKIMAWKTKRYKMIVGANVAVNDYGTKVNKKGIKLKSSAPKHKCYSAHVGIFVNTLLILILLNFW